MKIVEFIYSNMTKQSKKLQNNVFVLFSPERILLQPGEPIKADMKLSMLLPNQIILACTLLPTFCKNGLKLENCYHILADNNTTNFNQPKNLPLKLQFELVNRSMNTTLSICKRLEIIYITSLNEELEQLEVKYAKI